MPVLGGTGAAPGTERIRRCTGSPSHRRPRGRWGVGGPGPGQASTGRQPTPSGGNMTRPRMGPLAALIACVGAFSLAGPVSAQEPPAPTAASQKVAITGTKGFKGTYTIKRFL